MLAVKKRFLTANIVGRQCWFVCRRLKDISYNCIELICELVGCGGWCLKELGLFKIHVLNRERSAVLRSPFSSA